VAQAQGPSGGIKREGSAPYPVPRMGARGEGSAYNGGAAVAGLQDLGAGPGLQLPGYSIQQPAQMQQISLDQRRGPAQFPMGAGGGPGPSAMQLQVRLSCWTPGEGRS
jgi:hypothetical protein